MRRDRAVVLLFSALLLFASACAWEPDIDKNKFAELDRTARDMGTVIASSDPCDARDDLGQRLAAGIASVRDKAATKAERDLVAAYARLLITYRDGLLLCRSRTHMSNFDFFPKGRIYVTQDLDPLVRKYDLPVEKHVFKGTGQYMRSIDGNSVLVVWDRARNQIRNIETTLKYN